MAEKKYIELGEAKRVMEANDWLNPAIPNVVNVILDRLPTADVVEVVHGEWLLKHVGHGHFWECSVCHTNPCIYVTENTKFCPNCGAKMDGGKEATP